MATATNDSWKTWGNAIYTAALLGSGMAVSRYALTKVGMKNRPVEFKLKSVGMLTLDASISTLAVGMLQDKAGVPKKIFT